VALNSFIQKNSSKLQQFFDTLVDATILIHDEQNTREKGSSRSLSVLLKSLATIHLSLVQNKDFVWDRLLQNPLLMPKFKDLFFFGLSQIQFPDGETTPFSLSAST